MAKADERVGRAGRRGAEPESAVSLAGQQVAGSPSPMRAGERTLLVMTGPLAARATLARPATRAKMMAELKNFCSAQVEGRAVVSDGAAVDWNALRRTMAR